MHSDSLDNVVLFAVATEAVLLAEHLQTDRLVWMHFREGRQFVAVSLLPSPGDLGRLLRVVEAWAAARQLTRIGFEVDGRRYTLRPQRALVHAAH